MLKNIRKIKAAITVILFLILNSSSYGQQQYALVVHGGAGVMLKSEISEKRQAEYKATLEKALVHGEILLKKGLTSTDAVVEVIKILEDSPLFNAGKGAVFTSKGKNELDASIMNGSNRIAGAVASVRDIRNPIMAAREVMNHSEHVLLSGKGASKFARKQGLEIVKNKYFFTKSRFKLLKELQKMEREHTNADNIGTVGCVALDTYGNLCAGTSTGGMTNKKFGRIGDSPIIGAGNYADNNTCGVSCTGHGEYFIRLGFSRDISALMEYKKMNVKEACNEEMRKLGELGGTGGVVALDTRGNIAMEFNTSGMFRGYIKSTGEKEIAIFANE